MPINESVPPPVPASKVSRAIEIPKLMGLRFPWRLAAEISGFFAFVVVIASVMRYA